MTKFKTTNVALTTTTTMVVVEEFGDYGSARQAQMLDGGTSHSGKTYYPLWVEQDAILAYREDIALHSYKDEDKWLVAFPRNQSGAAADIFMVAPMERVKAVLGEWESFRNGEQLPTIDPYGGEVWLHKAARRVTLGRGGDGKCLTLEEVERMMRKHPDTIMESVPAVDDPLDTIQQITIPGVCTMRRRICTTDSQGNNGAWRCFNAGDSQKYNDCVTIIIGDDLKAFFQRNEDHAVGPKFDIWEGPDIYPTNGNYPWVVPIGSKLEDNGDEFVEVSDE